MPSIAFGRGIKMSIVSQYCTFIISSVLFWQQALSQEVPSGFRCSRVNSTSLELTWNEIDDVTYNLKVERQDSDDPDLQDCEGGMSDLKPGVSIFNDSSGNPISPLTRYQFTLCTIDSNGSISPPARNFATTGPPAPYNVTTSSNSPNQLDVKWDDQCAIVNNDIGCFDSHVADVYTITYKTTDGAEQTETLKDSAPSTTPPREIALTNLTFNTAYTITIQIEGHGATEPTNYDIYSDVSQSETGITILDKPTSPVINNITESSINISWDAPSLGGGATNISGYLVIVFPDEGDPPNVIGTTGYISGLTSNTEYTITVSAMGSVGKSGTALEIAAVTIPEKVESLSSTAETTTTITLQWNEVKGTATETYSITWTSNDETVSLTGIGETSEIITDLKSNTMYSFQIQAVNEGGEGELSDQLTAFTILDKPTSPVINDVTESSINISWDAPSLGGGATNISEYLVTVFPNEGDSPNVQGTTAHITGLTSNEEYAISVAAMGSDGRSGTALQTAVIAVLDKPKSIIITGMTESSISISWDAPFLGGGATSIFGYHVTVFPEEGEPPNVIGTTANITGLTSNKEYTISVAAIGSDGRNGTALKTTVYTVPAQPREVSTSCNVTMNTNQICINWLQPDGGDAIDEYIVKWSRENGSIYSTRLDHFRGQSVFRYTINGLLPGEKIVSNVTARNDAGEGTSLRERHITNPSVPTFRNVFTTASEIAIVCEEPIGFADIFVVESLDRFKSEKNVSNNEETIFVFSNLSSATTYQVIFYSAVNNSDEENIESERAMVKITTKYNLGFIIGVTAGSIVGLFFLIFGGTYFYKRKTLCSKELSHERSLDIASTMNFKLSTTPPFQHQTIIKKVSFDSETMFSGQHASAGDYDESTDSMHNTVQEFWRMVVEENYKSIITLSSACAYVNVSHESYWPTVNKNLKFGSSTLKLLSSFADDRNEWIVREIKVVMNGFEQQITQYHFTSWDNDQEDLVQQLTRFVKFVCQEISQDHDPVLLQCSNESNDQESFIVGQILIHRHATINACVLAVVEDLKRFRTFMTHIKNNQILFYRSTGNKLLEIQENEECSYINFQFENFEHEADASHFEPANPQYEDDEYVEVQM